MLSIVKFDPVRIEGEHVEGKDVSYAIWQQIKSKYPEDYEKAVPFSEWTKRKYIAEVEFSHLGKCTDTEYQDGML